MSPFLVEWSKSTTFIRSLGCTSSKTRLKHPPVCLCERLKVVTPALQINISLQSSHCSICWCCAVLCNPFSYFPYGQQPWMKMGSYLLIVSTWINNLLFLISQIIAMKMVIISQKAMVKNKMQMLPIKVLFMQMKL